MSILPPAETTFFDQNGVPLAGGHVYFFIPNTLTPKDTYTDQALTLLNTNPVTLDAGGRAIIWGAGIYRQQVYDVNNNLIWDQLTSDFSAPYQSVYVKQFGAVGNGIVDDTAAINAALQSLIANGGKGGIAYMSPGSYLANSANIVVPDRCSLVGTVANVGQLQFSSPPTYGQDQGGCSIFLSGSYTITLGNASALTNVYVINSALAGNLPFANSTIAATAVAAFAGTAITGAGADNYLYQVMIAGFAQAYYSTQFARHKFQFVEIDCTNGIWIDASFDISRLDNVHCWEFLTSYLNVTSLNKRSGSAFKTTTHFDGGMLTNCFEYGWAIGYDIQTLEAATLLACYADGVGDGTGVGFKFTNNGTTDADLIQAIGGGSSGQGQGAYINAGNAGNMGGISLNGLNFWGNYVHIKSDQHKILKIDHCYLRDTSGGDRTAIELASSVTGQTAVFNTHFEASSTAWNVAAGPLNNLYTYNNTYAGGTVDNIGSRSVKNVGDNFVDYYDAYDSTVGSRSIWFRKFGGTPAVPAATTTNATVGGVFGYAYDGTNAYNISAIRFTLRGAASTGNVPGALVFSTLAPSSTTITDHFILDESGNFYPFPDNVSNIGAASSRIKSAYAVYFQNSCATGLTAAGTNIGTALQLAAQVNNVTTVAASTGVILPAVTNSTCGAPITVFNNGASVLQVYATGATIDGVAGATGVPLTNGKRCVYYPVGTNVFVSAQLGVVSA